MPPVLDARSLRKSFGAITAVSDVSFTVDAGELVGLPGPNGAGKSTTVGMIEVAGGTVDESREAVRRGKTTPAVVRGILTEHVMQAVSAER